MQVFKTHKKLNEALKGSGISLGMVPTMGALHEGHLALIRQALKENDRVVVSIFVNPTQFNDVEDLKNYPRNLDDDLAQLEPLGAALYIYTPKPQDLYAEGVVAQPQHLMGLDLVMEGAFRQHHFDGVATVVEKLLRSVNPDRAYFGEKDFQQLQIIRCLVEQQKIPVQIIGCPIVRAADGLALSSRNLLLNPEQKSAAPFLYQILQDVQHQWPPKKLSDLTKWVDQQFKEQALFSLDYFVIAEEENLQSAQSLEKGKKYRSFIAAKLGGIRLIDNMGLPII